MVFFNQPLVVIDDEKHSKKESRHFAFGKTDLDRKMVVVFCIRKKRIRVISARDMNKKERKFYQTFMDPAFNFHDLGILPANVSAQSS